MKKCVLINCFASSNEMRVEPIRDILNKKGFETIYVSSDFHHTLKKYVKLDDSIIPIHVRAYKKNLSINRLLSHKEFSKKVYNFLCKEHPDLIYIKFPPNSLVKIAYEYKRKNNCKIILDLFDLWPESLPLPDVIKKISAPLLNIWKKYRDRYISCADLVLTECNMYQELLKNKLPPNTHTLYLTKKDFGYDLKPYEKGKLKLCFIGGINNLVNLDLIGTVIEKVTQQGLSVSLDIIGDGKKRNDLIQIAMLKGAKVVFHGVLYDECLKKKILSNCDLGLNLVKTSVHVALSIKSIEYFRAGLGVVNNVPFDTERMIKEYFAGYNIQSRMDIDVSQIDFMKKNARKIYEDFFSIKIFNENFVNTLASIGV